MQNNSPTVIGPLRLCAYMLWTVLRNWRLVLLVKRFRLHDCRQYLSAWQEASQVSLWNRRRVLLRLQFQDWRSSRAVVHATDVFQPTQDALSESRPPFSAPSPFDAVGPCESVDLSGALFPGVSSPTEPQQSVIPPTVVPSTTIGEFTVPTSFSGQFLPLSDDHTSPTVDSGPRLGARVSVFSSSVLGAISPYYLVMRDKFSPPLVQVSQSAQLVIETFNTVSSRLASNLQDRFQRGGERTTSVLPSPILN